LIGIIFILVSIAIVQADSQRVFIKLPDGWHAPDKDPAGVLDYSIDWTLWLGSDTITNSTWTLPTGITNSGESFTTLITTIWLSGGTAGTIYTITNKITTAAGRITEQSFHIRVRNL